MLILQAMLLRVGIDKGSGGALAPIFEDGSFEYIPIPEGYTPLTDSRTYLDTIGRSSRSLSYYLPKKIKDNKMHIDPEFETYTYGDPTGKRKYLLKLDKNDLLVFYAGLKPFKNKKFDEALYIIGYFTVKNVIDFNKLTYQNSKNMENLYRNNAHMKRISNHKNLVIVVGENEKKSFT